MAQPHGNVAFGFQQRVDIFLFFTKNGTPFITTLDGKLKSIIQKYNNGIFIPNKDPINISIFEELLVNQEYLNNLRKNAKDSYEKLFNFDKTYSQIEESLKKLLLMETSIQLIRTQFQQLKQHLKR